MGSTPLPPFERFQPGPALGLIIRGENFQTLLENAALGLMSLVIDPNTLQPGGVRDRIQAEGADRETLLIHWLNQILFLYSVQQMVFCRFHIRQVSDRFVEAEGEGELFDPGRHQILHNIKSARVQGLKLEQNNQGWAAQVHLEEDV